MLNIYCGDMPEAIYNTAVYFKNTYEYKWITDDLSRQINPHFTLDKHLTFY